MIIPVYDYMDDDYSIMFGTLYHTYWYIYNRGLWQQIIKFLMNALYINIETPNMHNLQKEVNSDINSDIWLPLGTGTYLHHSMAVN